MTIRLTPNFLSCPTYQITSNWIWELRFGIIIIMIGKKRQIRYVCMKNILAYLNLCWYTSISSMVLNIIRRERLAMHYLIMGSKKLSPPWNVKFIGTHMMTSETNDTTDTNDPPATPVLKPFPWCVDQGDQDVFWFPTDSIHFNSIRRGG